MPERSSVSRAGCHLAMLALLIVIGFALVGGRGLAMRYHAYGFLRVPETGMVAIAVLAAAIVALVMWKAETGAILVILLLPLMDMYNLPFAGVNIKLSDWVAVIAIVMFLIRLPLERELSVPAGPLRWPVLMDIEIGRAHV